MPIAKPRPRNKRGSAQAIAQALNLLYKRRDEITRAIGQAEEAQRKQQLQKAS
jgi:hypothetical protein